MSARPTVLQVVHGYPPREVAGTEVYTWRLTEALRERGWRVEVLAATRDPGRAQGTTLVPRGPGGPHRVVNNLPWRPLAQAEQDSLIERALEAILAEVQPDLVHVQHLLFLSCHLRWPGRTLATLHDAWAWCARGGTLLRDGREHCPGPEPAACAACYADWARGAAAEHALGRAAGHLGRWVAPERLHAAWRALPEQVRGLTRRGAPPPTRAQDVPPRQAAVTEAFRRLERRLAPSAWLAALAERHGLGETGVLPHGVAPGPPRRGEGPLVFLGSLVPHKGAHLVVEAWQRLRQLRTAPPLDLVGPHTDPAYSATLPAELLRGPVPNAEVPELLAVAPPRVLGRRRAANAPLVVLEARASGCPVVAPRSGGLPELIEPGVDGVLYAPGDLDDLVRALAQVLDAPPVPRPPPTFADHVDAIEAHYRELLA